MRVCVCVCAYMYLTAIPEETSTGPKVYRDGSLPIKNGMSIPDFKHVITWLIWRILDTLHR